VEGEEGEHHEIELEGVFSVLVNQKGGILGQVLVQVLLPVSLLLVKRNLYVVII
jgi:hypothetical protein